MNDEAGRQPVAFGELRIAGGASAKRAAFREELGPAAR
jgi:hypothetical protein